MKILPILLLATACTPTTAPTTPASKGPQTIEAQEFVLKDKNGKRRAVISLDSTTDSPSIVLLDARETPTLSLGQAPNGTSQLRFYDQDAAVRMHIGKLNDKAWGMNITDKSDRTHASVGMLENGDSAIKVTDSTGKTGAAIVANAGVTNVQLFDPHGSRVGLTRLEDSSVALVLSDTTSKTRMTLDVMPNGKPGIKIAAPSGEVIWRAP